MNFTIPDFVWSDLHSLSKADKARRTRLRNGKMTHSSFYDSIKRDLQTSASEGRTHRYCILLKMYEETIMEVQGRVYFQKLVDLAAIQLERYKKRGNFFDRIPFSIPMGM